MNVSGPLAVKPQISRFSSARLFIVLIILGSLTSCFSSEPIRVIPTIPDSFNELKKTIVPLRGLSLNRDITLDQAPSQAGASELNNFFAEHYSPSAIPHVERAYKRIGLIPESTDFARAMAEYNRLEQMTFYDASKGNVVIGPEAFRLGQVFAQWNPRAAGEIPAVFGISQALQEQNFQWDERLKSIFPEDRRLAFRALAKGDATLVALTHASGEKKVPHSLPEVQIIGRLATELEKSASQLPEMLRQKLVFPYREGSQFVLWAYAAKGWEGVNGLYANPPLSTSQILHPERYYIRRENPVRIFPWGLTSRMKQSALLEQTLGEFFIRLMLTSVRSAKEAVPIASDWQGDELAVYQEGDDFVTAWISSWKNDASARIFFRAYGDALARHHRVRLDSSADQKEKLQAQFPGGRSMVLQVKGSMVLFLHGLPLAQSLDVAVGTWRDLETVTEPTITPLELGRRSLQLSPRSR